MNRVVLWIAKALGETQSIEGITVIFAPNDDRLDIVERLVGDGIRMVKEKSPAHWRRIRNHIKRIYLFGHELGYRAAYQDNIRSCLIPYEWVSRKEPNAFVIARLLVHESTHGLINRRLGQRSQKYNDRQEAICQHAEINFVRKVYGDGPWKGAELCRWLALRTGDNSEDRRRIVQARHWDRGVLFGFIYRIKLFLGRA